jgi:hypothetical protein
MYNGGVTVKETSEDSRQVRKLSHEKLSYRRQMVSSETVAYVFSAWFNIQINVCSDSFYPFTVCLTKLSVAQST